MFLLLPVRHVGAHPDGHQHGISIQISINFGKTFLRISRIRNITLTSVLARFFVYLPPFISQILDFIYWTVLIFILIYFERRDTENQQSIWEILVVTWPYTCPPVHNTSKPRWMSHSLASVGPATWYCTATLWSIDSCQNRMATDRYHMTISRDQVSIHRGYVFFWSCLPRGY